MRTVLNSSFVVLVAAYFYKGVEVEMALKTMLGSIGIEWMM